jgi:hypothetical protein
MEYESFEVADVGASSFHISGRDLNEELGFRLNSVKTSRSTMLLAQKFN